LKFESFAQKTCFIKVLILRPTFNFKKISGGYTPVTPLKGRGEGRGEGKGRRGKGQGRGAPPQFTFLATPLFSTVHVMTQCI